jgi:hypothetical protein
MVSLELGESRLLCFALGEAILRSSRTGWGAKMSKKKLAGIIVGCIIAVIVVIVIATPSSTPAPQPDTESPPSAEFTVTDIEQSQLEPKIVYRVRITLVDFLRGEEAWAILQEVSFSKPPRPGFEYILVNVDFELLENFPSQDSYTVNTYSFHSLSANGEEYDRVGGDILIYPYEYPELSDILNPGESCAGWIVLQVAVDDDKPLMSFGRGVLGYTEEHGYQYDDDGLWFKLYNEKPELKPTPALGYDESEPAGIGYPLSIWVYDWGVGGAPQDPVNEERWSEYVYIYYDVKNSGEAHIGYYEVWFTITYDDGTQYEDWTNGLDLLPGEKWSNYTIIKGEAKKAVAIEVSDYELTAGTIPAVIYKITGTAEEVDVTLSNATGGTEQYSNVSLPKKYTYTSFDDSFTYISAQNQGASGTVTVSIYVNGTLFKTSSSSGAYVIATASGLK